MLCPEAVALTEEVSCGAAPFEMQALAIPMALISDKGAADCPCGSEHRRSISPLDRDPSRVGKHTAKPAAEDAKTRRNRRKDACCCTCVLVDEPRLLLAAPLHSNVYKLGTLTPVAAALSFCAEAEPRCCRP